MKISFAQGSEVCVLFIQSDQLLLSAVMCTPERAAAGVVAKTPRLGQTVVLLVDIRQVEVFRSNLVKVVIEITTGGEGERPKAPKSR